MLRNSWTWRRYVGLRGIITLFIIEYIMMDEYNTLWFKNKIKR